MLLFHGFPLNFKIFLYLKPDVLPKTQRDPDSEFNYIHFGIDINNFLKSLKHRSFCVQIF